MSKRPISKPSPKKKGPNMNPNNLMSQVQQMQQQMSVQQEALASEVVTITAGGGAVTITITGHQRIQSIKINPEVVDAEDVEMLEDMLVAGINAAIEQSQTMAAQRMENLTGGLNMDLGSLLGGLM